ncbi:MAG: bifunctional UDP-N-acetylmuramoyl-tripeptide:D-alanyl-D-alanine ligase/alanine racemase [Prevotella sp.]|nr:bifunctional UDP-N-acetylmuramoyl-tripeptide:D-alanyl-D-alanine ligase/alanine racemase [Prevotella sp.]
MNYSIEQITTLIGARRIGTADAQIGWLLTDSRSLCFPESTLFFALKTTRNDGHHYIEDLYRRGVRNFVVESGVFVAESASFTPYPDANYLVVPSSLAALQRLAERHRDEFDIPIIGIAGSNGKTMVKEWLYQLLSPTMNVVRSPKSYNSQIGVPLSIWLLNEQAQIALIEAGISQPDEMGRLADIIQPTIGVLTSLGTAHQENFRSMEEKCMEKLQLFRNAKVLVYNSDDDVVSRCIRRSGYKGEKIGWSRENISAPFYIEHISEEYADVNSQPITTHPTNKLKVSYLYNGTRAQFILPFCDKASLECSLACAAVGLYMGLTPQQLSERMANLEPIAMRLEVKEGQRGCLIINDSYNSDVNSLAIALDFMARRIPDDTPQSVPATRRTLILSDIFQSGMTSYNLYREVNSLCMERGINKLIGIGSNISSQRGVFSMPEKAFFTTTEAFLASKEFHRLRDEMILIKGARAFGFDRITEQLEQKVHETILEVNLGAIVENLNYYRSFLKPETKLVCMIKADAYGTGAVEVAKTLQDHRVDYLAVAVADEGVTLRQNGVTQNIMIMNPEMTAFKTMFDYDLEPEVYSFRLMEALIRAAEKQGITGWPVHIKFDTGMKRLGFDPEQDIDELIQRLKSQNAIIPRSVFSHFAGADDDDFDEFSAMQFERFDAASRKLQTAFSHKILRHISNSAAIEHFPERQMDMCRLGLGLYGVSPRDNRILHTVSTLKTTILQIRHVPKEETVGYSRKGVLSRDSVIAAIPIGYADGLNRHLGRGACYCLVNGQKAPYVGNICMDVAMIDVTDIDCQEGDTVEIFGEHLPITILSDVLGTIPYEVMTGISNRVKKVYFQD